jgi:hypothetical protein
MLKYSYMEKLKDTISTRDFTQLIGDVLDLVEHDCTKGEKSFLIQTYQEFYLSRSIIEVKSNGKMFRLFVILSKYRPNHTRLLGEFAEYGYCVLQR